MSKGSRSRWQRLRSTGTSLPFAKAAREQRGLQLLELGIMDEEDYLDMIDLPGKEKILAKFKERQEAAQEQAAFDAANGVPPQQG